MRDWEFIPCSSFHDKSGDKTKEVVGSLAIACGAQANGGEAMCFHGVVLLLVIFVDLVVGTERCTAMVLVVETMAEYDFTRAPSRAGGAGEVVEPHNDEME